LGGSYKEKKVIFITGRATPQDPHLKAGGKARGKHWLTKEDFPIMHVERKIMDEKGPIAK